MLIKISKVMLNLNHTSYQLVGWRDGILSLVRIHLTESDRKHGNKSDLFIKEFHQYQMFSTAVFPRAD